MRLLASVGLILGMTLANADAGVLGNVFGISSLCDSGCCDDCCVDECVDACCDDNCCDDGCCGIGDDKLLGLFVASDHCFDDFVSPMTNPIFFEDPRTLTELRPIYMHHKLPQGLGGEKST